MVLLRTLRQAAFAHSARIMSGAEKMSFRRGQGARLGRQVLFKEPFARNARIDHQIHRLSRSWRSSNTLSSSGPGVMARTRSAWAINSVRCGRAACGQNHSQLALKRTSLLFRSPLQLGDYPLVKIAYDDLRHLRDSSSERVS